MMIATQSPMTDTQMAQLKTVTARAKQDGCNATEKMERTIWLIFLQFIENSEFKTLAELQADLCKRSGLTN